MVIKILESTQITMEMNEKTVEIQKLKAQLAHKGAELEDLMITHVAAKTKEFKMAIDQEVKQQNMRGLQMPGQTN